VTASEPISRRPASTVTVYPDGPLIVRGDFEVREVDGESITGGHTVALCRCGRSAVKPFCDGSHKIRRIAHSRRDGRREG
jgi:CDGSH-type Zn-finger protein